MTDQPATASSETLLEQLVAAGIISQEQHDHVLELQERSGDRQWPADRGTRFDGHSLHCVGALAADDGLW